MLKTVSSITNAIGALNFKGTWNAATNTPTIVSGVGVKGDYFVVSVAGSTTIDGISNWGVGDWITYNGAVWQRVEGGADLNGVNLSVSGTTTLSGLTASTALALNATKEVVSVANTGTGNNVLADGPTLTTPALGAATATSINKVALTAPATGSTLTIADGKTLTANHSLTLAGTDGTTQTFPSTSATIARTDASQTFTGAQTFSDTVTATKFIPTGNVTAGNGMYLPAANTLGFSTNGTERLTIDSVGSPTLKVSGESVFRIADNGGNGGNGRSVVTAQTGRISNYTGQLTVFAASGQAGGATVAIASDNSEAANTAWKHFQGRVFGSGVADTITINIFGNGDITNTNNSYGSISDIKLKQDIVDAGLQWNDIKNIRVRKFRFKDNPTGFLQIGVVAQELEEVSPGLVEEIPDYEEVIRTRKVEKTREVTPAVLDEDGNEIESAVTETYTEEEEYTEQQATGTKTKAVKYSVLYMKAIKALQEAMQRIEALESEVAKLKT